VGRCPECARLATYAKPISRAASFPAVLLVQRRGEADHRRPFGSLRRRDLLESRSRRCHQVRHRLRPPDTARVPF